MLKRAGKEGGILFLKFWIFFLFSVLFLLEREPFLMADLFNFCINVCTYLNCAYIHTYTSALFYIYMNLYKYISRSYFYFLLFIFNKQLIYTFLFMAFYYLNIFPLRRSTTLSNKSQATSLMLINVYT